MTTENSSKKTAVLVKASARHLHLAPRKMRLVTNAVKGMYVDQALTQLSHMNKKGAPMVSKLIQSAMANAKNNFSLNPEFLYIKSITADMGQSMKRYFPRARGSAFVIRRKLCHVNVELEEKKRKTSSTRSAFLERFASKQKEAKATGREEAAEKTSKDNKDDIRKPEVTKTSEQRKMNTVQQKRRLFNRKAGE